ncbi:MAG: ABC transporter ATP-binding protein [Chloroflexota bacterium]
MLQIQNLTRNFHSFRVLNNISLELNRGEILGVLGPNGAGKTTFFRVLTGFLPQDDGVIRPTHGQWPKIGYKPERLHFPSRMTARQYLATMAAMSGLSGQAAGSKVQQVIQLVGMVPAADKRIRDCSKGMKQRIGLAQAMIGDPDVLVLDEPGDGLDPIGQQEMQAILRMLREQGKAILLSSHRLNEVKAVCTDIAIMSRGEIVYKSSIARASEASGKTRIFCDSDLGDIKLLLESLDPGIQVREQSVELSTEALPLRRDVLRLLLSAGHDVLRIERPETTLNEVYAKVIRQ